MKNIINILTLTGIMLVISFAAGCGRVEDKTEKVVSESPAAQTVIEQKAVLPAEKDVTASEKTQPADVADVQPIAPDIKKDLPSESKAAVPQETESVKAAEARPAVQDISDVIVIENKTYTADKKGPVTFNHVKHNKEYKAACDKCHHLYKDGENQWKEGDHVDKCVVCHDPSEDKDKAVKLQNAFHQNCKDCHNEASKEGKKAPYTKCADCHVSPEQ